MRLGGNLLKLLYFSTLHFSGNRLLTCYLIYPVTVASCEQQPTYSHTYIHTYMYVCCCCCCCWCQLNCCPSVRHLIYTYTDTHTPMSSVNSYVGQSVFIVWDIKNGLFGWSVGWFVGWTVYMYEHKCLDRWVLSVCNWLSTGLPALFCFTLLAWQMLHF